MGGVRDIVVPCPTLGQGFWEKPVQKTQGLTAKKQVLVCRVRSGGEQWGERAGSLGGRPDVYVVCGLWCFVLGLVCGDVCRAAEE